jgi:hypothetical protein
MEASRKKIESGTFTKERLTVSIASKVLLKLQMLPEEKQRQVLEFIAQLPTERPGPRISLFGLFKGIDTTEEDIAAARREMWGHFPREEL